MKWKKRDWKQRIKIPESWEREISKSRKERGERRERAGKCKRKWLKQDKIAREKLK